MKTTTRWQTLCIILLTIAFLTTATNGQGKKKKVELSFPESWSEKIEFRSIGPANMSGRITSLAVYEDDPCIWWAASASGGLLKTTNNGIKFEHQFDDQATVSIGDVQVSKTNPDLVWVGTGEANPRNSVSWGDGVYKSTDGGKTWKNMGLKKTFQIGRIAIHPEDHDIVYVGALGRLWGRNPERGLFKTTDGGKTWDKILFVDDKTGVIDLQMNPENPDELIVATYERLRDGFDGNDPATKYGAGSALYKTTDGGKSFNRLSQGLPGCKLGRIGLSYCTANPSIVAAIVESEKIAKEPEDAAYAGLRGEDADVGAKITQVVDDGPAEKAGLKEGYIVVSIDGTIVYSYQDLLGGIRKNRAGETTKLIVSRERKPVDVTIELVKKPVRKGRDGQPRRSRSPFTGTLGGQAANLQGQQGEGEQEYGGIYLSEDGGDSWTRINTLNPRPMYYSQIRIDPTDPKNIYVLGTSLYRSKDGGETFTGDGGRGIHVDHHALWIDPDDSRHMILGNDGGIHVTHDRMDNWDHLNHVAIGQFYHAGIGPQKDYRVYGGLQDNGSWGGPSRVGNDTGSVNTDWFRVGGGDGFITLVDPQDPDQIYFESQNGSMGRINLRTGDRGFIRPRPPRGTRYRFNWKTPFILSPHNSRIHYSAGNHVFRSFNKGQGVKAISPDITNTNKGAGSAITESPVQAGVLYVGTTDGAVWVTKDGGQKWDPIYTAIEKKAKEKDEGKTDDADKADVQASTSDTETKSKIDADKSNETTNQSVTGTWNGTMISDRFPADQAPKITLILESDDQGNISGEVETRRGSQEITEGKFDSKTGELIVVVETRRGRREFEATVKGNKLNGEMTMRDGQITVEFEAIKKKDPDKSVMLAISALKTTNILALTLATKSAEEDLTGKWKCNVSGEQIPGGGMSFDMEIKMDKENFLTGVMKSPQGEFKIVDGSYKPKTGKVYIYAENEEEMFVDVEGQLDGKKISGDATVNDAFTVSFVASKETSETEATGDDVANEPMLQQSAENTDELEAAEPGFLGVFFGQEMSIQNTLKGSPAEAAGMLPGDKITKLSGEAVESQQELISMLRAKRAGDEVALTVERDGKTQEFKIVLASRPADPAQMQRSDAESRAAAAAKVTETPDSPDEQQDDETKSNDDGISGTWTGTIETNQGTSDLTLVVKRNDKGEFVGTYETTRSSGEITEGSYKADSGDLVLTAESGQFTLEFIGKVEGDKLAGDIEFNQGSFTMPFNAKRTSKDTPADEATAAAEKKQSKADGETLEDLVPGPRWVSSLHASQFKAERCYITLDGHRSNDDEPHLFVTENFGKSWKSIRGNLPSSAGSVRVLREDIKNQNLLYLGCEFGAWVSIDRGRTWTKFKGLPTVAVHEIAQHPTLNDVLIATHGRSLWITDVGILRQTDLNIRNTAKKLYQPNKVIAWRTLPRRGSSGNRKFVGQNPERGTKISYSLGSTAREIDLTVLNLKGEVVKRFTDLPKNEGLHVMNWDLRRSVAAGTRGRFARQVGAGEYLVNLRVDGELLQTTLSVINDPNAPNDAVLPNSELQWWLDFAGESGNL